MKKPVPPPSWTSRFTEGWSDARIARAYFQHQGDVARWRRIVMGTPDPTPKEKKSTPKPGRRKSAFEPFREQFGKVPLADIAAQVGRGYQAAFLFAKKNGLPYKVIRTSIFAAVRDQFGKIPLADIAAQVGGSKNGAQNYALRNKLSTKVEK